MAEESTSAMFAIVAQLILTPEERRTAFTACAPSDMQMKELKQMQLTSITPQNFQLELPQSLGKVVIFGTSKTYLDALENKFYISSQTEQIWKIVINKTFTMGQIEDLFAKHSVPRDIGFIILPAWPCEDDDIVLKYLFIDHTAASQLNLEHAGVIEKFFTEYFNGKQRLFSRINQSGAITHTILSQTSPLYIANPFGAFTEFMVENIKFCVITASGNKHMDTNCLFSIVQPRTSTREGRMFIPGHAEVNLTNILTALQAQFNEVRTVALNTIIGTMVRLNQFEPNSKLSENRFALGYGLGILSGAHLHRMIFSGQYNRVAYFKYNQYVMLGYSNISNGETILKTAYKEDYISYMCEKIIVIFKSTSASDPYDATEEKQFYSNATDLSGLEGFNVWVYIANYEHRQYVFMGTITRAADGSYQHYFASRQDFGNPINHNITLLVCTAKDVEQLVSHEYEVPKLQFRAALYISAFPRYIKISIVNMDVSHRSKMYFGVSVNMPGEYEFYLNCFYSGEQVKYFLGLHRLPFMNSFISLRMPDAQGFCRIYVCPHSPGFEYGLEFEMTDVCGVSLEFSFRNTGVFIAFAMAACIICGSFYVLVVAGVLVSDYKK